MKRLCFLLLVLTLGIIAFSETEVATSTTIEDLISRKILLVEELNTLELKISELLSSAASISLEAQDQLNELRSEVNTLMSEIDRIGSELDSLNSIQNGLARNLAQLQSQLKDLEKRIGELERDILALKESINSFEEKFSNVEGKITDIEEQLTQLTKKSNLNFMLAIGGIIVAIVAVVLNFLVP
ncbi:DUF7581 domain-containing protein [Kosmotoga pacifica]|uniref:CT398-like coiled coil hairpin domain-containing protein n=1 Tax=Kosmotoga pacifica TaxID=1330330 RepID=A0A0G2ZD03_9BACT|nr:hypothetical protein [Kosmotoga pacifica]AKI97956.1 hypothetical protein IX53_09120 [Kosmotoga pacifica]